MTQGGGSSAGDGGSGSGTAEERLCRRGCAGWAGAAVQAGQNQGSAIREAGLGWGREEEMNLFGPPPLFK